MKYRLWFFVVLAMCLLLVCSTFYTGDVAAWLSDCAVSVGVIYLIIKNRNK